jgi:hypothetical protein
MEPSIGMQSYDSTRTCSAHTASGLRAQLSWYRWAPGQLDRPLSHATVPMTASSSSGHVTACW